MPINPGTIARMAGNIACGIMSNPARWPGERMDNAALLSVAEESVYLAGKIAEMVENAEDEPDQSGGADEQ